MSRFIQRLRSPQMRPLSSQQGREPAGNTTKRGLLLVWTVGGITLVAWMVRIFDTYLAAKDGFHIVASDIEEQFWPIIFLLLGVNLLLRWKLYPGHKLLLAKRLGKVGIALLCLSALLLIIVHLIPRSINQLLPPLVTAGVVVLIGAVVSISRRSQIPDPQKV